MSNTKNVLNMLFMISFLDLLFAFLGWKHVNFEIFKMVFVATPAHQKVSSSIEPPNVISFPTKDDLIKDVNHVSECAIKMINLKHVKNTVKL